MSSISGTGLMYAQPFAIRQFAGNKLKVETVIHRTARSKAVSDRSCRTGRLGMHCGEAGVVVPVPDTCRSDHSLGRRRPL